MAHAHTREHTLNMLRERRERIARELALLAAEPPAAGGLTARECLTWRTRLSELEARIALYSEAADLNRPGVRG